MGLIRVHCAVVGIKGDWVYLRKVGIRSNCYLLYM